MQYIGRFLISAFCKRDTGQRPYLPKKRILSFNALRFNSFLDSGNFTLRVPFAGREVVSLPQ
jgi:hypothetical protein